MTVERACNSGESRADNERRYFVARRVHSHSLRRQLILSNGDESPAGVRINDVVDHNDGYDGQEADPEEVCVGGNCQTAQGIINTSGPCGRVDTATKSRGGAELISIHDDDPNDLG